MCCAPRRPRDRPRRAATGATLRFSCSVVGAPTARMPTPSPQRRVRRGRSAPLVRREGEPRTPTVQWTVCAWRASGPLARRVLQGQGLRPRAQRGSSTDSSRLSERRERSERSEFRDAAARPSIAAQSGAAPTAPVKRCGLGARAVAATKVERHAAPCAGSHFHTQGPCWSVIGATRGSRDSGATSDATRNLRSRPAPG